MNITKYGISSDIFGVGTLENLTDGYHTVEAFSTDTQGNIISHSITFLVNTTIRFPAFLISPMNITYRNKRIPLAYNIDNSKYMIYYCIDDYGYYKVEGNITLPELPEGQHTITAKAYDLNGVIYSKQTAKFTIDTTSPEPISSPESTSMPSGESLSANQQIIGVIIITAIVTSVSSGLLFYLTKQKKQEKNRSLLLLTAITAVIILSLFATIYAYIQLTPSGKPVNQGTPSIEPASPEYYFQVKIAYAYAGPLPPDKASYVDPATNETWVSTSKYPSSVFLEFTPIPSMTNSCDAVVEAYGVKIIADTGPTEYFGWTAGTADYYKFTQDDFATLNSYRGDLIYHSAYTFRGGTWCYNWAADKPVLSKTIGSVGSYTMNSTLTQSNRSDLSSAGIPKAISVEVYRIGYITMTNGSVTIHEDPAADSKPVAYAQLTRYGDGFIYNTIVPTEQLSQIDLFHPPI
ncbi:MAG: hypothetical protein QXJ76_07285 [Candidatus Bathyarchaeia archaeon]